MQKKLISICMLLILFSISLCPGALSQQSGANAATLLKSRGSAAAESSSVAPSSSDEQPVDDATYLNHTDFVWSQYAEDLQFSSDILDGYVRKEITREQAMAATMAAYMMTFQQLSSLNGVTPPEKFKEYQNYTANSVGYLQWYLWYMAKFYETNKSTYAVWAYQSFNTTRDYREKALEERLLHLT